MSLQLENDKEDSRIYTLSQEKPAKAVVKMSVPLIAGMLIMVLYNLVDTFFIGLTGDDYQLAAVYLCFLWDDMGTTNHGTYYDGCSCIAFDGNHPKGKNNCVSQAHFMD